MNLLYESHANLGLFVFFVNPSTEMSFKPKFKMVSIIPGIDTLAPDLTDTKRGFSDEPNSIYVSYSTY